MNFRFEAIERAVSQNKEGSQAWKRNHGVFLDEWSWSPLVVRGPQPGQPLPLVMVSRTQVFHPISVLFAHLQERGQFRYICDLGSQLLYPRSRGDISTPLSLPCAPDDPLSSMYGCAWGWGRALCLFSWFLDRALQMAPMGSRDTLSSEPGSLRPHTLSPCSSVPVSKNHQAVVMYTLNPSTRQAEAGAYL